MSPENKRIAVRTLTEILERGGSGVSLPADSFLERAVDAIAFLETHDEGGLPVHLAMGVNKHGQGPEGDSTAHHYECWCANEGCHWNVALERAAAVQRRRIAAALHAKADANIGYSGMEEWVGGYQNAAVDVEIEIDNLMEDQS